MKHQDGTNLNRMDLLANDKNIKKYCASIAKKRLVINNDTHKMNGILPEEINSDIIDKSLALHDEDQLTEVSSVEENS